MNLFENLQKLNENDINQKEFVKKVDIISGYNEDNGDDELFENLKIMKESLSRSQLIDEIEKYHLRGGYLNDLSDDNILSPNVSWADFVEQEVVKISGKSEEELPDDDPDEGFYSNLSTSELEAILDDIHATIEKLTEANKTTIELTNKELQLVKTAMEMWSDASFSKSHEEADIAKDILNKLK